MFDAGLMQGNEFISLNTSVALMFVNKIHNVSLLILVVNE
jgi:hypothetical protein